MAVDTRSKRASVLGIGLAIGLTLPLSDGTVSRPDRQHVAFSYAGLQAEEPFVAPADLVNTVGSIRQRVTGAGFVYRCVTGVGRIRRAVRGTWER